MSADGEGGIGADPVSGDAGDPRVDVPIARSLVPIIGARLGGNILIRFPYTFATAISRGLGIDVDTLTALLGMRELGGLASPAIGHVADRGHERRTMVAIALVAGLSCLLVGTSSWVPFFVVLLVVGGIAKFGLDTAQSAWIAHRVPFARRSRVFGVVELSWALALLVGVKVCAWFEDRWGWQAMFVFCGAFLVVTAAGMQWVVPRDEPSAGDERRGLRVTRAMWPMFAYVVLQPFAQMFVFAVYGDWFVTHLGMSTATLATTSVLIGFGELVGTGMTAIVTDRIGKRRAAIAGILLAAPMAASLGTVGDTAWLGVTLIVVMAVGTEFSFVSALPIIAELDPDARAASIGAATVLMTIARAVSSALSGLVYVRLGMGAAGAVGALACVGAAVALWSVVEPGVEAGATRSAR
jgi:predicted MFS family arabinose efflux permease